jgi:NAD-dependent deacetylase
VQEEPINRAAHDILHAKKTIALTGAGISVESGIPDFRSEGGLWSKYDPEEYAHIDAFRAQPEKVWVMLREMLELIIKAKPNPAHRGLALMEEMGLISSVVTQNVDGLHQAAGSKNVIEFHGTHRFLSCLDCGLKREISMFSLQQLPPKCPNCETLFKPDVIFFGEPIPREAYAMASYEAQSCDLVLVIGTSAAVLPAADIPRLAKAHGAAVAEINLEETSLSRHISDYSILGPCTTTIPEIVKRVRVQKELQER